MATNTLHPIACEAAWLGRDVADSPRWRIELDGPALAELEAALAAASARPWQHATRDAFPLPGLGELLAGIADELENGLGMVRLGGIPVERYTPDDQRRLLLGIGCHLGTPVYQTARGELMGEIADEGPDVGRRRGQVRDPASGEVFLSSRSRAQSTGPLRWHTDRCDAVGLLCVQQARAGGESRLASAVTVHNVMCERRPDLARLLYQDIPRSRLGEEIGGERCFYPLPVFAVRDGRFTSHYSRTFVEAAQKDPSAPRMTPAQWEALDMLAEVTTEVSFEMTLRPGDLQLLNNHVIYHGRAAFEDHPEPARKRRLYRIWLSMPNSRALPEGFEVLWGAVGAGALRGGMCQTPLEGSGLQWSPPAPDERIPSWLLPGA